MLELTDFLCGKYYRFNLLDYFIGYDAVYTVWLRNVKEMKANYYSSKLLRAQEFKGLNQKWLFMTDLVCGMVPMF